MEEPPPQRSQIAFLSTYPPKECGIATFTQDLVKSIKQKSPSEISVKIIALNEETEFYNYGKDVIYQINQGDIENFIETAKKINKNKKIKTVSIQHEFGLYGGEYGSYLIPFLETLEKPVFVTFHSVLPNPDKKRKKNVQSIASRSSGIIVMAKSAIDILEKQYKIDKNKIHLIYHGIPNVPLRFQKRYKHKLRLNKKIVLSTFGLLSQGKGIEYIIEALPNIVKKYPNLVYLVIGETHPVVRKNEGEKYRKKLIKKVEELGLKNNVKFYNKFLDLKEILNYLQATDIYICTNLEKNQITSGTLSYALGCGRCVISTPSLYAEEILSNDRGILVELKNPKSYEKAILNLLENETERRKIERTSYTFGRQMRWPNVASRYLALFNKSMHIPEERFPSITIKHLKRLTDKRGIIQFANNTKPKLKSGYTIDDNSRALITSIIHTNLFHSKNSLNLSKTYLDFIEKAQQKDGNFQNNFENENEELDRTSEDAFGRTLWSLGFAVKNSPDKEIEDKAKKIFDNSLKYIKNINSTRARAFTLIGLCYFYSKVKSKEIKSLITTFADYLTELYNENSSEEWKWFEEIISYSNSKISESLFLAYNETKNNKYLEIAEKSLNFLKDIIFCEDFLCPVGQNGWYKRNGERAFYDQQPVDASAMVQTCLTAYNITKNKEYYKTAKNAFLWFLGKNHLNQMLYDEKTGGCYDGLSENSINLNQGAESTVSYLIARLLLEKNKQNRNKISSKKI